ncbi:hypothetical protein M0R45_026306 [Rubus argutus]|uniref:Uncharacterized protein n=1 Tax=Rubus argutus TaxID=59490 RepID=A0AAW1WYT8_RUBAR
MLYLYIKPVQFQAIAQPARACTAHCTAQPTLLPPLYRVRPAAFSSRAAPHNRRHRRSNLSPSRLTSTLPPTSALCAATLLHRSRHRCHRFSLSPPLPAVLHRTDLSCRHRRCPHREPLEPMLSVFCHDPRSNPCPFCPRIPAGVLKCHSLTPTPSRPSAQAASSM